MKITGDEKLFTGPYGRAEAVPCPEMPLALKMCAGCTRNYAVEGDAGDEQGGTAWFGPCCPVPPRYQDVYINPLKRTMGGGE